MQQGLLGCWPTLLEQAHHLKAAAAWRGLQGEPLQLLELLLRAAGPQPLRPAVYQTVGLLESKAWQVCLRPCLMQLPQDCPAGLRDSDALGGGRHCLLPVLRCLGEAGHSQLPLLP